MMKNIMQLKGEVVLYLTSPAFKEGGFIPSQYTCDGKNINPPLDIGNIPRKARCLALIVHDPDAPRGDWVHWLVWNIPLTDHIGENQLIGTEGLNDFNRQHYGGPCPPSGTHRYFFKLYALDTLLDLPAASTRLQLEQAMDGHILGFGMLMGLYKRRS